MPPSLGGLDVLAEARLSPASVAFLAGVTATSPARRLSPNGPPYKPRALPQPAANLQLIPGPVVAESGLGLPVQDQPRRGRSSGAAAELVAPAKTPRAKSKKPAKAEIPAASVHTASAGTTIVDPPGDSSSTASEPPSSTLTGDGEKSGDGGIASGTEGSLVEGLLKALKAMPTTRDQSQAAESKAAEERDADSENEADGGEALREAMAGIHMHGSATRSGGEG